MIKYLCVIQARLGSTRFPNKVMETVGGVPMVRRVWNAAKQAQSMIGTANMQVIVAWPERYPELDENDVLGRFKLISREFPSKNIIRLTADCPMLRAQNILDAIDAFEGWYYNNRKDGYDVQIFNSSVLDCKWQVDTEHVIKDTPNTGGISVNTKKDLNMVRACA